MKCPFCDVEPEPRPHNSLDEEHTLLVHIFCDHMPKGTPWKCWCGLLGPGGLNLMFNQFEAHVKELGGIEAILPHAALEGVT